LYEKSEPLTQSLHAIIKPIQAMDDCCKKLAQNKTHCPSCDSIGKAVQMITLRSLLQEKYSNKLSKNDNYYFCSAPSCDLVYFNTNKASFTVRDLGVKVFQKDAALDVPVCYCFGWTRKKISDEIQNLGKSSAIGSIKKNIQAGRCACEINNPQGSCCLGNVSNYVKGEMNQ